MARDLLRASSLAACVVVLVVAWRAVCTLRQYRRLRHIPGPRSAGLSKWWLIRSVGGGRTHLDPVRGVPEARCVGPPPALRCTRPCSTQTDRGGLCPGSVARIGPNDLVTSDPELMKRMLNVRSPY